MKSNYFPHLLLLCVSVIFGANYWVSKSLMPEFMTPAQVIVLRAAGALLLIWPYHYFFAGNEKVDRKDLWKLAYCSFFGIAVNQILFYEGLNLTSPIDASIIHALNPMMVMLFAAILLKEKISILKAIGIGMGFSGAMIIILQGKEINLFQGFWGNLLIFLNGAGYALYLVLVKPLMDKYRSETVIKWIFFFGLLYTIPYGVHSLGNIHWDSFTGFAWLAFIYIILINSFVAYLLMVRALRQVNATVAGFYTYLQPVFATLLGIIFLTEIPSILKIGAALLIFSGAYMVSRKSKK